MSGNHPASAQGKADSNQNAGRNRHRLGPWLIASAGIVLGLLAAAGFSAGMAWTNTEAFCISCHEMRTTVYEESKGLAHDRNAAGVHVGCPACHVPVEFLPQLGRKIRASKDLYHHFAGTIDTLEKFRARRLHMAQQVWRDLEATDSRECRHCHSVESMDFEMQTGRAARQHEQMSRSGKTCIDCHKGIAHSLPDDYEDHEGA